MSVSKSLRIQIFVFQEKETSTEIWSTRELELISSWHSFVLLYTFFSPFAFRAAAISVHGEVFAFKWHFLFFILRESLGSKFNFKKQYKIFCLHYSNGRLYVNDVIGFVWLLTFSQPTERWNLFLLLRNEGKSSLEMSGFRVELFLRAQKV